MVSKICWGQTVSAGAIGGLRVTPDITGPGATDESRPYVVGAAVELGLRRNWVLELDALYERQGYKTLFIDSSDGYYFHTQVRLNSWQTPVLLRYAFPIRHSGLFVVGGFSPRAVSGTTVTTQESPYFPQPSGSTPPSGVTWPVSVGAVAGAGARFPLGNRLEITPQVRYVRWFSGGIQVPGGPLGSMGPFQSTMNEVQVMVGFGGKIRGGT